MIDLNSLMELDRQILAFFNGSDSLFLDGVAMTLTSALTWIPLYLGLLYIVIKNNETMAQIVLITCCVLLCLFLADGLADYIVKPLVGRWRPTNDPVIKYTIDVVNNYRETKYGFFSAHAANTFGVAWCVILAFRCDRKNRYGWLTAVMLCWATWVSLSRVFVGKHFLGDVLVGIAIGTALGLAFGALARWVIRRLGWK